MIKRLTIATEEPVTTVSIRIDAFGNAGAIVVEKPTQRSSDPNRPSRPLPGEHHDYDYAHGV
jgi:hypothetical protein